MAKEAELNPDFNKRLAERLNDEMRTSLLPVTIFVGIETVFGFFGNIFVLYVYVFRYHKCNFKYFVLCLAFLDLTSTMTTMPGELVTQQYWFVYPVPMVCKIKSFFNVFTVSGSAFCLLVISIDRFRKICRPLEWQIRPRMALVLCFILLGVSFFMALPGGILWGTHSHQEIYEGYKINVTVCERDEKFIMTLYPMAYTILMETVISIIMITMLVQYIFICRKLLKSKGETTFPTASKGAKPENDTTFSSGMTSEDDKTIQSSEVVQNSKDSEADAETGLDELGDDTLCRRATRNNKRKKPKIRTGKTYARRIRRKTLIMLILTAVFISTTVLYLTLLNLITDNILETLSNVEKACYFLFFRLYFINHVINPILYGVLDPHFRSVLKQMRSVLKICRSTV